MTEQERQERLRQWASVYDETYQHMGSGASAGEDFSLWKSACTGDPIPQEEMRQWLNNTLDAIRSLHAESILEIGCGHGLVLLNLACECTRYVGVDFSSAALHRVCEAVEKLPPEQLELLDLDLCQAEAADLGAIGGEEFHALVYNSVVQYFPDVEYLQRALEQGLERLRSGGKVFVGDVRNADTANLYRVSQLLHQLPEHTTATEFRRAFDSLAAEDELLLSPAFWHALPGKRLAQMRGITRPKMGSACNELMKFRYDVTLVGEQSVALDTGTVVSWADIAASHGAWDVLDELLVRLPKHSSAWARGVRVTGIPDSRTYKERCVYEIMFGERFGPNVSLAAAVAMVDTADGCLLQHRGVSPEELIALAMQHGMTADIRLDHMDGASLIVQFDTAQNDLEKATSCGGKEGGGYV